MNVVEPVENDVWKAVKRVAAGDLPAAFQSLP